MFVRLRRGLDLKYGRRRLGVDRRSSLLDMQTDRLVVEMRWGVVGERRDGITYCRRCWEAASTMCHISCTSFQHAAGTRDSLDQ